MQRCRGYIQSFEYDLLMMENWMENSIIFFMFGLENSFFFLTCFYIFFLERIWFERNYTFLMFYNTKTFVF